MDARPSQDTTATNAPPAPLPCNACGYDLAGVPDAKLCPECGAADPVSRQHGFLDGARIEYVRRLRSGLGLVLWSFALPVLVYALALLSILMTGFPPFGFNRGLPAYMLQAAVIVHGVMPASIGLLGHWRYTTLDMSVSDREQHLAARHVVRWATWAIVAFHTLFFVASIANVYNFMGLNPVAVSLARTAAAGSAVSMLVQLLAMLRYTRSLARRLPNERLAQRVHDCQVLIIGSAAIAVVCIPLYDEPACWMVPLAFVLVAVIVMYVKALLELPGRLGKIILAKQYASMSGALPEVEKEAVSATPQPPPT